MYHFLCPLIYPSRYRLSFSCTSLTLVPTAERVCKEQHEKDHVRGRGEGGLGRSGVVIACSALKKWYRDILRGEIAAMPPKISDLVGEAPFFRGRSADERLVLFVFWTCCFPINEFPSLRFIDYLLHVQISNICLSGRIYTDLLPSCRASHFDLASSILLTVDPVHLRSPLTPRARLLPRSSRSQPPSHPSATPSKSVDVPATANLLTLFLYCHGSPSVLAQRIARRKGHFMGARMLESQLATLEDPREEKGVASVEIDQSEEDVAGEAVQNVRAVVRQVVGEGR